MWPAFSTDSIYGLVMIIPIIKAIGQHRLVIGGACILVELVELCVRYHHLLIPCVDMILHHLLGILGKAHAQMQRMNKTSANQVSVRLELLADYYAGVWAHYEDEAFGSLDESDLKEAINCAQHIGDNYLQEQAQGYSQPESFTHGTSDQRMRWLKRGYLTGDMSTTTFTGNYSDL